MFIRYNLVAWVIPAFVVGIAIATDVLPRKLWIFPQPRYAKAISKDDVWVCWIMNSAAVMVFFNIPIAISLTVSMIFFGMTIYVIAMAGRNQPIYTNNRRVSINARRRLVIYLRLSVIMGLTWLFGLLAAIVQLEILWLLYALTNALQGFYIGISFICTRRVSRLLELWISSGYRDEIRQRNSIYSSSVRLKDMQLHRPNSKASFTVKQSPEKEMIDEENSS